MSHFEKRLINYLFCHLSLRTSRHSTLQLLNIQQQDWGQNTRTFADKTLSCLIQHSKATSTVCSYSGLVLCVNNFTLQFLSLQVGPLINHKNQYWQPVWHLFQWVSVFQAVDFCRNCRHIVVTFSSLIAGLWTKEWLILIRRAAVAWGDLAIDSVYCLLSDSSGSACFSAKQEDKNASKIQQGMQRLKDGMTEVIRFPCKLEHLKYNLGISLFS